MSQYVARCFYSRRTHLPFLLPHQPPSRLLVALHAPHDGSVLLDAHAHHCITLTNSFRWSGWSRRKGQEEGKSGEELSKSAENNSESLVSKTEATQVQVQKSDKTENSRKSGSAQAWNMDDLADILSAVSRSGERVAK